jgi:hypothetical protein
MVELLEVFAVVVARLAKDQRWSYPREITREKATVVPAGAKDQFVSVPGEVAGCRGDGG